MRSYPLVQLDVFTDRALAGNPLAVFPECEGLSDEEMLKIAREMNLSETVFVLPPRDEKTLRRLRIYTPTREIPFAGHPVVGTWNALARLGVVTLPEGGTGWTRIFHEIGIGVLPVDLEFKDGEIVQVVMTQGSFEIQDEIDDRHDQAELARLIGHDVDALDENLPIQIISTGLPFLAVPLRSIADLRTCRINGHALSEFYRRLGSTGCLVFTRETIEIGAARAHARMFAPDDNIPEDPATGSACGALGGYLIHHHAITVEPVEDVSHFVIEQGDFINRPSRINLEVRGTIGNVQEVKVGGPSVVVMRGELLL
ncbi:MAG TPA: PhzF family phenazine biosynthesis protein [Pyrinomonadaceae bacterium]|nr:PhzF family phenazine biosynthesis protein [Pyrinomonadaceae bacterium]